tara:strand:+ start:163 stop:780 length:618 start_codon:yes stop_codon:yes gene_type:complete
MSEEILSEIEEDLQKERIKKLWNVYGKYIILFIFSVILFVGGWQFYSIWQEKKLEKESNLFYKILNEDSFTPFEGKSKFSLGYDLLLKFQEANSLIKKGDQAAAQGIWSQIALNNSFDKIYRKMAILLSVMYLGDESSLFSEFNEMVSLDDSLGVLSSEIKANILLKNGNKSQAKEIFQGIINSKKANIRSIERINTVLETLDES